MFLFYTMASLNTSHTVTVFCWPPASQQRIRRIPHVHHSKSPGLRLHCFMVGSPALADVVLLSTGTSSELMAVTARLSLSSHPSSCMNNVLIETGLLRWLTCTLLVSPTLTGRLHFLKLQRALNSQWRSAEVHHEYMSPFHTSTTMLACSRTYDAPGCKTNNSDYV